MKNVAILNNGDAGSTGNIAINLHNALKRAGYNSIFCFGRGHKENGRDLYRIENPLTLKLHAFFCRLTGKQGFYSTSVTVKLLHLFDSLNIDTIYIVCIHGYYINERYLYKYVSDNHIRLVHLMIDEYAFTGKCAYTYNCTRYLQGCGKCPNKNKYPASYLLDGSAKVFSMKMSAYAILDNAVFVGPKFVVDQALASPLFKNNKSLRLCVLDEAIDMDIYYPRETNKLRESLGIKDDKIIITCVVPYYGEENDRKGGRYFIELARKFVDDTRYCFVHVGYNNSKTEELPGNYIPVGFIKDQNLLAEYFSLGDLFVFPSLQDTMPNACLDALACGTPLLCFNISGMPFVASNEVGIFVEPRSIEKLYDVIIKTHKKTNVIITKCRNYALSRYDSKSYNKFLIKLGNENNDTI